MVRVVGYILTEYHTQLAKSFDKIIIDLTAGVYFSYYILQLAKMSFDEIFDLTAGVYLNFYNITYIWISLHLSRHTLNIIIN